jgi:hypothetical protein
MLRYLLPLLLLAVATASAQPLRYEKFFSVDGYSASASSIRQTSDGGFIIAGKLTEYDTAISSPKSQGLLLRIDGEGNTIWYKTYGPAPQNYLIDVHQTSDGGFIACGVVDEFRLGTGNREDHWLIRTDAGGDTVWTRQYRNADDDQLQGLLPLPGGDYLVYGTIHRSGSTVRGYLARIDGNGNTRWTQEYITPARIYSVVPVRDGGFAVVGGATLLRVDSAGKRLWDTSYASRFARIYHVIETSSGGYALAGDSYNQFSLEMAGVDAAGHWLWDGGYSFPRMAVGNVSFRETRDRGYVVVGHEAVGNDQALLLKTDIVGKQLWERVYDTVEFVRQTKFHAVEITPENDFVMTGYRWLANQKVIPGSAPISRVDSEGYVLRPAPDRFWKRLRYTGGGTAASLTIDSAGTILVGEYDNTGRTLLYRSTDDGLTWSDNNGPGYRYESMVTLANGDIIAIRVLDWISQAPDGTGGWRSTDRGVTWMRLDGFPEGYLSRLALSRGGDLYAMGRGALHRSSNNATGWDSLVLPDAAYQDIAVSPNGTVYITTDSAGVLRSTDRGATWDAIGPRTGTAFVARLGRISIRREGDLFVSMNVEKEVYHSSDDGATWRVINGTPQLHIASLAFDRYGAIYASTTTYSTNRGTWRSTDDGVTWTRLSDTTMKIDYMQVDRKGRMLGVGIGIFRTEEAVASVASDNGVTESLSLHALPNPFSDETVLHYRLPVRSDITITIVDRMGKKIATLADGEQEAGEYRLKWNSDGCATGVYYCVMRAGREMRVEPLVVVR